MPHPGSCWFANGLAKLTSRISVSHNRHEDFASIMLTIISIDREATPQRSKNHNQLAQTDQGKVNGREEIRDRELLAR